jgi:hypothetical protein
MSWLITGSQKVNWTPANITTALWLDANDSGTITESSSLVSQWNDKSGNARHATASSTARPTYSATSFNSKPGISFDGTANVLRADGLATIAQGNDTPWSVVFVGNLTSGSTFRTVLGFGSSTSLNPFHIIGVTEANLFRTARRDQNIAEQIVSGTSGVTANRIFGMTFGGTSATIYQNGSQDNTGSCNVDTLATTIDRFSIGALTRTSASGFISCVLSEVIISAAAISTDTRQRIEGYLAHKWGLTGNLPSDHPYKVNVPTP